MHVETSLLFFGVRILSLTAPSAVPFVVWFGDPRLRKRELDLPLSCLFLPIFFVSMVPDGMTTDTHAVPVYPLSAAVAVYRTRTVNGTGFA